MPTGVYPRTEETRRKMSLSAHNRICSEETRQKLSAYGKTRTFSDEHRQKISAAGKDRKFSAETRLKISAALKGNKNGLNPSEETRKKLRLRFLGVKHSLERRLKVSATLTGKKRPPFSDEARRNMAAGRRAYLDQHPEVLMAFMNKGRRGKHVYFGGVVFRSSYEARLARAFSSLGLMWEYEPVRFKWSDTSYLPDFYLPGKNLFVEVKGQVTPESLVKVHKFRAREKFSILLATLPVIQNFEHAASIRDGKYWWHEFVRIAK